MGLVSFLTRRREPDLAEIAVQIAALSREAAADLTVARAKQMTLGEARGYIRARSRETIVRQGELLFRRHAPLAPSRREEVVSLALDQVVYLVMRDLVHQSKATRRRVA